MNTEEDQLPPHSLEAEQAMLGCIMLEFSPLQDGQDGSTSHCLRDAMEYVDAPDMFYDARNQEIYRAMLACKEHGKPMDQITLHLELQRTGRAVQYGYTSSLPDFAPAPVLAGHYAQEVLRFHLARKLIQMGHHTADAAHSGEPEEVASKAMKQANDIIKQAALRREGESIKSVVLKCIDKLDAQLTTGDKLPGIPTGYADIDRATGGLVPKAVIVLAARPSVGKSALAVNIAGHAACDHGKRVLYISLEMGAESLVNRLIHARAQADMNETKAGRISHQKMGAFGIVSQEVGNCGLRVCDSIFTTAALEATIGREMDARGLDLVVIDYMQLLRPPSRKSATRENDVAEVSRAIKGLALEHGIPILALAQLNRETEKAGRTPKLSDLRESGQIEQDADVVIFLWRDDESDTRDESIIINGKVAKNRDGERKDFRLVFFPAQSRFESAANVNQDPGI